MRKVIVNWGGGRSRQDSMAGFHACNVLVTGANRGLGLELVKQFLEKSNPPERVFAACRNPEGAQVRLDPAKIKFAEPVGGFL